MPANTVPFLQRKNYSSMTVTVPSDGANHKLLSLMQAVDPKCAVRTKFVTFQNDSASAGTLLLGEAATDDQGASNPSVLSATNFGRSYAPGATEDFGGIWDEAYDLARFNLRASGGAVTLHVQAFRG